MTKTKDQGVCPVCGKSLYMVAKHIRQTHMVRNKVERAILNNMTTGRTVIPPGPCPIPGCTPHVLHVAKHLKGHTDITVQRTETEMAKLKKAAAIAALARLRATNPQPPMATSLDVEDPGEGSSTSHRQLCQNPDCRRHREKKHPKSNTCKGVMLPLSPVFSCCLFFPLQHKLQAHGEPELSSSSEEVEEVEAARPPQQQQPEPSSSSEEVEKVELARPPQQQPRQHRRAEETFQVLEEAEDINVLLLSRTMCRGDISDSGGA
ncbi:hypothetical protein D5F01_LYC04307 [Larimichthys crocea]|uniref:Uncharacterized protein n=1 Tax=Larimichthys crocea TaxID=215358 RepID=A0A6G0J1M4_LARCR|nr:hypothetical protein D5F01_LYC04307 [Larimichthys crocea]